MLDRNPPLSKSPNVDCDTILGYLTARQHLRPHAPLGQALQETTEAFGCCPQAIERALQWLGVDSSRAIGRLRRSELTQLARAVHRFWQQAIAAAPVR
ncbi:MAG TPA: hypothetical protein VHD56_08585 [Tepidisphaeraceae bacterium]|nr:hypothetical protein [Tepidisphaeraceae bacterium]